MRFKLAIAIGILALLTPALGKADVITVTWPEQNGPDAGCVGIILGSCTGVPVTLSSLMTFTIPAGQSIVSAVFSSTYGNSTVPNTAIETITVNGVQVGACTSSLNPCWNGLSPTPFSYTYTAADLLTLLSGTADLVATQTDCCIIREGVSTLVITTTPEPGTLALFGSGIGLLGLYRRRLFGRWLSK